jgi:CheY-like chemotaxis protein
MKKKILLVDDDPLVIKTLQKCLRNYGYEVETALSGAGAVEKVKQDNFDLIISDFRMPNIDGVETIAKIRQIYQSKNYHQSIPAVMITGYSSDKAYRQAMELEVTDFLHKPFKEDNPNTNRLELFSAMKTLT